jgi:hypothetical protein
VFTARNRQNPFAKRRRAQQAEAEAAEPAPEPATLATGGIVEPRPGTTGQAVFPPSEEETTQANVVLDIPPISAETQAKIDEIVNRAVPPVAEPAEAWAAPDPDEIDAQVTRHETVELPAEVDEDAPNAPLPDVEDVEREAPAVEPEPTPESETAAILADPDTMAAIADAEAEQSADEPKRGRGRPRPVETIVRDGKVYDLLKAADPEEGISKEALAIKLVEKEQQVYSSLRQLSKEGRAETRYVKGHGYRWFAL